MKGWFAQEDDDGYWCPAIMLERGARTLEGVAFESQVECVVYIAEHIIGVGFR